jgi:hypothetical protein
MVTAAVTEPEVEIFGKYGQMETDYFSDLRRSFIPMLSDECTYIHVYIITRLLI